MWKKVNKKQSESIYKKLISGILSSKKKGPGMARRVLIVDDDPELLEELKSSLMDDYEVVTLQDSKEALDTAVRIKPDVVLLDVGMPKESGLQAACDIMYFSGLNNTEIIMMSGDCREKYEALTQLCGFKGFLLKPFCYEELQCKLGGVKKQ